MNLISELMTMSGVIAAGEYAYRGDRYSYEGQLTDEMARMASVMCRATSLSVHMECNMLDSACDDCGLVPGRGWAVRGPNFTVCVMSNYFCFLDNGSASLNDTLRLMMRKATSEHDELV